jgi:hypothetical protein
MAEQDQPQGILVVDKPEGFTSHDVVARVRRILTKRNTRPLSSLGLKLTLATEQERGLRKPG